MGNEKYIRNLELQRITTTGKCPLQTLFLIMMSEKYQKVQVRSYFLNYGSLVLNKID